ncbi:transketolase [Sulfolobales archaeon HS-7]|nr:transketolase [Sulfolobales archaeon HS-7]
MREALGKGLLEIGAKYNDVMILTADVGDSTRASYFRERYPDRYFNVGISEQDLVGFASGMATMGLKPLIVNFGMFLLRAWEQIRNTVCRMNLNVKLIATHTGFSDSGDGSSHQVLEDIALMRVLPNMRVVIPADSYDINRSLEKVVTSKGPLYYRIGRDYSPPITRDIDYEFEIGKAQVLTDGDDLTFIGAGVPLFDALQAARDLKRLGISAAVVNLLSIKPIDENLIEKYARKTGRIITVEEHNVYGGIGSAVAEVVISKYPVRIKMVGTNGFGRTAKNHRELLDHFGLSKTALVNSAKEIVFV